MQQYYHTNYEKPHPHKKEKKFPFSLQHCRNVCVVKLSLSFTTGKIDRYQKIIFDSAYLRDMK